MGGAGTRSVNGLYRRKAIDDPVMRNTMRKWQRGVKWFCKRREGRPWYKSETHFIWYNYYYSHGWCLCDYPSGDFRYRVESTDAVPPATGWQRYHYRDNASDPAP